MKLKPGTLVVLEGVDKAGKTTQRDLLAQQFWQDPAPAFVHMPSGLQEMSREVYRVTETQPIRSAIARQLLHLACHAENLDAIRSARVERGVVLDRWWWSTLVYGWYAGLDRSLSEEKFREIVDMVWGRMSADLIFLFLSPLGQDRANSEGVYGGYRTLMERQDGGPVVEVAPSSVEKVSSFIRQELKARGLVHP